MMRVEWARTPAPRRSRRRARSVVPSTRCSSPRHPRTWPTASSRWHCPSSPPGSRPRPLGETLSDTAAQSILPNIVDPQQAESRQRSPVRGRDGHEPVRRPAHRWCDGGCPHPDRLGRLGARVRPRRHRSRAHQGLVPGGARRSAHEDRPGHQGRPALPDGTPAAPDAGRHGGGHEPRQQRRLGGVRAVRAVTRTDGHVGGWLRTPPDVGAALIGGLVVVRGVVNDQAIRTAQTPAPSRAGD